MKNPFAMKNSFAMKKFFASVLLVALASGCQTIGPNTAGGGAIGTLAGSLTGAAIGATEGKAPEGALIGALAGGTAGSVFGSAIDRDVQQQRFAQQQFVNQQIAGAITMDQVVRMTQSGLGGDVVTRQIASQGIARRPTIEDLIFLKQNGVQDNVIHALQSARVAGQVSQPRYINGGGPVFVDTYTHLHAPPRFRHQRHVRRCGPGVDVVFGF